MADSKTADRVKELNTALADRVASNKEIADSFEVDEKGTVHVGLDQKAAFDQNMKDIREIRSLISDLSEQDRAEKWLSEPASESAGFGAQQAKADHRSLGEMFLDSPEFKELQNGKNGASMRTPFELKRANIGSMWRQKDLYAGDFPTTGDFPSGAVQRDMMEDRNRRPMRVRDLFPVQNTTAGVIEYFRVAGFTNAASTVPQRNDANTAFGLKPQSSLSFTGHQAPVRTIAHWEAAHRNVLADEPQLRGIIDNELLYGLRLTEDAQILAGSGTGEDLEGILNTAGIQSYDWSSGATTPVKDTKADALRRAATLAFLAYYQPTGVVLHPNDWEDIELTKNTQGDYLLAVSIALGGEPRVWRMPVVDTPAIEEGTALLGAFGLGAQLYDREEANIRIAEQHSDFFIRNAVVVLAEERLALAVKRPESFVEVNFDSAPA
jgi:HK97 family phage major capsid protein